MRIFTRAFWLATLERTIGTAGAVFLATIGSTATLGGVDWPLVADTVALASVLTIVKALVAGTAGDGPGFGSSEGLTASRKRNTHRADD